MSVLGALPSAAEAKAVKDCISVRMSELLQAPTVNGSRHQQLWAWLRQPAVNGKKIMALLSQDPKLAALFTADSGVPQGYTIRGHNLRVYRLYENQVRYFGLDQIKTPESIDLANLIKFTIALHDIGKPLAVKAGNKALQHLYTIPIMDEAMPKLGFSKAEINLAKVIVDNDVIGELDQGLVTPEQAYRELNELAAKTSLSPRDFFRLQTFFYTIDAGSYPGLLKKIFTRKDGKLVPASEKLIALNRMFEQ
jgi:hypothetical protein